MTDKIGILVVVGCGGVGSNVAMLAARTGLYKRYVLVDFDLVEAKNLERQFFFANQVGKFKVDALRENIKAIDGDVAVDCYSEKLESAIDCLFLNGLISTSGEFVDLVLATDNTQSKRLIYKELKPICNRTFLVNCEAGFYEIKGFLDEEETKAWVVGSGYYSTQTWASNLAASAHLVRLLSSAVNPKVLSLRVNLPDLTEIK